MSVDAEPEALIHGATGALEVHKRETLQSLWSGYGSIDRYALVGAREQTVILKHVRMPQVGADHPRGWNSELSHQRKATSYRVEINWYRHWAMKTDRHCRVPRCLAVEDRGDEVILVLEDLDGAGFPGRKKRVDGPEMELCLSWLAYFHARYLDSAPEGLWQTGTYWHLDTRPEEWAAMPDGRLKQLAKPIDRMLEETRFKTLVHGDAKLANFCFSHRGDAVAAVDFQYVGGGCGVKDLAYFISSCLDEAACERAEQGLLESYFSSLRKALTIYHPTVDAEAVVDEWRPLYRVAWTDFYRFLTGWSPGHWKIHGYSERLASEVIEQLSPLEESQGA